MVVHAVVGVGVGGVASVLCDSLGRDQDRVLSVATILPAMKGEEHLPSGQKAGRPAPRGQATKGQAIIDIVEAGSSAFDCSGSRRNESYTIHRAVRAAKNAG